MFVCLLVYVCMGPQEHIFMTVHARVCVLPRLAVFRVVVDWGEWQVTLNTHPYCRPHVNAYSTSVQTSVLIYERERKHNKQTYKTPWCWRHASSRSRFYACDCLCGCCMFVADDITHAVRVWRLVMISDAVCLRLTSYVYIWCYIFMSDNALL